MEAQLIDRIYESAFIPELWPGVLDELSGVVNARGGALVIFAAQAGVLEWTATEGIRDVLRDFVAYKWLMRGGRISLGVQHNEFLTEHSSDEDLSAQPMCRDFFYPRGLGRCAGTIFRLPTGTGGDSVEHIAHTGAVSINTVRSQVRGVLEKTGFSRQAQVVALLSGMATPGIGI